MISDCFQIDQTICSMTTTYHPNNYYIYQKKVLKFFVQYRLIKT